VNSITIPELSLVVLVGPSGCGKSTFAAQHFKPTEVISSDSCRALVSDDENNQAATKDAFEVLHFIAAKRLAAGKLTVVDATNVQPEARRPLIALARQHHVIPVALVLNVPDRVCQDRNKLRSDRNFGPHVIRQQSHQLRRSLRNLKREGFRHIYEFQTPEALAEVVLVREPLRNDLKRLPGPFDIIGDIHGCFDELHALLIKLGYEISQVNGSYVVQHAEGRTAVFLGDLVDRGPKTPEVMKLVMSMTESGIALTVPGNHDTKLMRKLNGRDVQITHGLAESLQQLEHEAPEFRERVAAFVYGLVSHYVLDDGRLVVAHAGLKEELQGRGSGRVRDFALYGETSGETDEFGLPVRYNWAAEYRGRAMVVYGHTPVAEPEWLNNTICVDTGCVFGGKLTALRYPEKELVSVTAQQAYYAPSKPFLPEHETAPSLSAQQVHDDVLDIEDVSGKRIISTRLHRTVTIREENGVAALEVMSRFAADTKWLIYLPPTMSPSETSRRPELLEHPAEAFSYFRHQGVARVVCEEKHMGSRAVVIACRDAEAARKRFGVVEDLPGVCYTRTGRRFFEVRALEGQFISRVQQSLERSGFWEEFKTDWVCLDCELMPWSAKAQELLRRQYAAVGAAARASLADVLAAFVAAAGNNSEVGPLLERFSERARVAEKYVEAYRRYCWPVESIADLKLAPFHVLATEGHVYADRDHAWHMQTLNALCDADDGLLLKTSHLVVDVTDAASEQQGIQWWEELTGRGGEGMVVKPFDFIARGPRGLVQPAVKCRGREYLRIIYGPEYTLPENLERLRARGLSAKRSLALREFALGIEALERFTRKEPLRRIHECVFGVLALESEPIDPRL
jgi:protein phosphatase